MNASGRSEVVLSARGLTKSFRGFTAVSGVDLDVRAGTIHAVIGPNGAGKTTLFNLLTRFLEPTSGTITLGGRDLKGARAHDIARLGMVRSFQVSAVFPRLTVRENIRVALQQPLGTYLQFWRPKSSLGSLDSRIDEVLAMVGLAEFAGSYAAALSYGRKRVLELATTLALDPKVLLLDEPMAGLGREDIDRISELIRTVSRGRTTLLVEHNLSVVEQLSDTITVLAGGKVIAEGPYRDVSRRQAVIDAYLGGADG
jgi:branched-chain amino acid transport system ATP-binding protein